MGCDEDKIEAAGLIFKLRSERVPLAHILLARPLSLSALVPEVDFNEANAAKSDGSKSARDDSFDVDRVISELLTAESVCSEVTGLQVVGVNAIHHKAPILATARVEPRHPATTIPITSFPAGTQQIWRAKDRFAVASKGGIGRRNEVFIVPVSKCEQKLRDCVTSMHVENKRMNNLNDVYNKLLESSESPALGTNDIFATVDGAKTISRLARKAAEGSVGDNAVEVTIAEPEGDEQITIRAAYTLAYTLTKIGLNREPVTAVELLNAATLAMRQAVRAAASNQHEAASQSIQGSSGKRNEKSAKTVEVGFKPNFMALLKEQFVKKVFECGGKSAASSHRHVEHALSGVELLNIFDSGTAPVEKLPPRLLLNFKRFFSQSKLPARDESSTIDGDMALTEDTMMVEDAVRSLWEMDGGSPPTSVDVTKQQCSGSAMDRSEAMRLLEMAAAFAGKPASQSLWDFAHRIHPDAAAVAFSYEYIIQRPNRGISKVNGTDFESFIFMSIMLSLALAIDTKISPLQSSARARSLRDYFPRKWAPQASSVASNLTGIGGLLDKLDRMSEGIEATKKKLQETAVSAQRKHILKNELQAREGNRATLYNDICARFVSTI